MPRFVILEHDHPELHWDLMLEVGAVLKTWRLAKPPEIRGEMIEAVPIGDHRVFYLDYEGPVIGGRGKVTRWDGGTYEMLTPEVGPTFRIALKGQRVQGVAVMEVHSEGWVFQMEEKEPRTE